MKLSILLTVFNVAILIGFVYLVVLLVRALRKYLRTEKKSAPSDDLTLAESIRAHRTRCGMTQEFVAEKLNVSRQAVSKWESGASAPSTNNLLALAKLFEIPAEELLNHVQ